MDHRATDENGSGRKAANRVTYRDDPEMIRLLCLLAQAEDRLDTGAHTIREEAAAFD